MAPFLGAFFWHQSCFTPLSLETGDQMPNLLKKLFQKRIQAIKKKSSDKSPPRGVKYSHTENSEFARGAEKTEAVGIDKFDEEEVYESQELVLSPEEQNQKQIQKQNLDEYH